MVAFPAPRSSSNLLVIMFSISKTPASVEISISEKVSVLAK